LACGKCQKREDRRRKKEYGKQQSLKRETFLSEGKKKGWQSTSKNLESGKGKPPDVFKRGRDTIVAKCCLQSKGSDPPGSAVDSLAPVPRKFEKESTVSFEQDRVKGRRKKRYREVQSSFCSAPERS